jgi:hypothetical protein
VDVKRFVKTLKSLRLILEAIGVGVAAVLGLKLFGSWAVVVIIPLGVALMTRELRKRSSEGNSAASEKVDE